MRTENGMNQTSCKSIPSISVAGGEAVVYNGTENPRTDSCSSSEEENCEAAMDHNAMENGMSGIPDMPRKLSMAIDDPFAVRSGKKLSWQDVNMVVAGKKENEQERKVLDNVWGSVPAKEVTAIMGPSGSGKTSLLNILSGRSRTRGRVRVSADVRLNNYEVNPLNLNVRKQIAFVQQEDSLQITATPREAIWFSAKLRLPRSTKNKDLDTLTETMLTELGLTHCAEVPIGGTLLRGISGGEKKRTSVGVELVVKPALVFLDEPTSGLDAFSAVQLVQVLHKVANAGSSVLFTIHQPSSEVFMSFHHLILLNKGRVMYEGSVSRVPDFFKSKSYPIPLHYNPADWIMYIAQSVAVETLQQAGFFPPDNSPRLLPKKPSHGRDILGITIRRPSVSLSHTYYDHRHVSFCTQASMLFKREMLDLKRNRRLIGARLSVTSFMSFLIGIVFQNAGSKGKSFQNNPVALNSSFGSLLLVLLQAMFGTALPSLLALPEQRPVFVREYSTSHYSVPAYFASKLCTEAIITFVQIFVLCIITYFFIGISMPFFNLFIVCYALAMAATAVAVMLGCYLEEVRMAQQCLPLLFVPQLLFSGFFVATSLVPKWLRWAQYLCSLTYATRIALVYEFGDRTEQESINLLKSLDVHEDGLWWYWLLLFLLFTFFRLLGLFFLKKKATKFY